MEERRKRPLIFCYKSNGESTMVEIAKCSCSKLYEAVLRSSSSLIVQGIRAFRLKEKSIAHFKMKQR